MWFNPPDNRPDWSSAVRHLRRADPALARVIARVGPCTLFPRRDYFVALCQAIYTQQISTAIATILFDRFRDQFPRRRPTPGRALELLTNGDERVLRRCGLSRQKRAYLIDLSRHFVDGSIPVRRLGRMDDEEVVQALVRVNGIGRWTAEMFLIFVLNRPDVLPVDDLGLREGVRGLYGLAERPTGKVVSETAERWRPWRTVATWYLWKNGSIPVKASAK